MKHYFVYSTIKKELLEDCQIHLEYESSFLSVDSKKHCHSTIRAKVHK